MNSMETSVYEYVTQYGIGGKCVYVFRFTYAGIKEMRIQLEKESRYMSMVMCTSIGTVTKVSIAFRKR